MANKNKILVSRISECLMRLKPLIYGREGENEILMPDGCAILRMSNTKNSGFLLLSLTHGANPVSGHERLYEHKHIVWEMNFRSEIINAGSQEKSIRKFLRTMLGRPDEANPCRGPANASCQRAQLSH